MPVASLGETLVIANPASHSGRAAEGAEVVRRLFETFPSVTTSCEVMLTREAGDARQMAAGAAGADTVVVVGGDGVIHDVVNGLMRIEVPGRPRLALVPYGSGNDFARTLGITANDPAQALSETLRGVERVIDLGYVTSDQCPDGTYFTESLSFGMDAAIALDTISRRARGTSQQGSALFATSAVRLALRANKGYPCELRVDEGQPIKTTSLILAVLNGPTYGGGFRICPEANPCDGVLDLCRNVRHPSLPHLLALLGLARLGRHARSRSVSLDTMRSLHVSFADDVPCQVDGEELLGRDFDVRVVPAALEVVVAPSHALTLAGQPLAHG